MTQIQLDQLLEKGIANAGIPGVVAMAVNDDGFIYKGAAGFRDIEGSKPMTLDSVFWIASMTKAITSVAAMQLVEKGSLSLNEPISEVLPDLENPQVLEGYNQQGEPVSRPLTTPITLRHLLTHTSGFTYDLWNEEMVRYQTLKEIPGIIECKNASLGTPLVFEPGEQWEYGISLDWVGKVIEAVSGKSLRDYLLKHIITPLGMVDTDFVIQPEPHSRLVPMHQRDTNCVLDRIEFEMPQNPELFPGGIGLYGTAGDYMKFLQMLLHEGSYNGVQLLQPETIKEMSRNQIGDLSVQKMISAYPSMTNDVEFFPGMLKKWGLGFMINTEDAPTGRSAGSLAWAGLGNTYFWVDPTKRTAGVLCAQLFPFADPAVLDLFEAFETGVYEQQARLAKMV